MSIVTYILTSWLLGYLIGVQNISALLIISLGACVPTVIDTRVDAASKHGFSHSIVALLLIAIASKWIPFMMYIAVGMAATIIVDLFGRKPIQLLWPMKKRFSITLIEKGKPSELVFVAILLIILFSKYMNIDTLLSMVETVIEFFGFFFQQIIFAFDSIIRWMVDAILA